MAFILSSENDGVTDRLGVTSVKTVYHAEDMMEALTTFPPAVVSLPFIDRQVRQRPDGGYSATLNYEGVLPGQKTNVDYFEVECTTGEEPIESHPSIEKLMQKYGGEEKDGRVIFPATISDASGKTILNELFGASVYYVAGIIWTRQWLTQGLPDQIIRAVGKIDTPPAAPGRSLPTLPGKRNWLKVRGIARWRGNVWHVTEGWMLSDEGGWNADVYGSSETSGGSSSFGSTLGSYTSSLSD